MTKESARDVEFKFTVAIRRRRQEVGGEEREIESIWFESEHHSFLLTEALYDDDEDESNSAEDSRLMESVVFLCLNQALWGLLVYIDAIGGERPGKLITRKRSRIVENLRRQLDRYLKSIPGSKRARGRPKKEIGLKQIGLDDIAWALDKLRGEASREKVAEMLGCDPKTIYSLTKDNWTAMLEICAMKRPSQKK